MEFKKGDRIRNRAMRSLGTVKQLLQWESDVYYRVAPDGSTIDEFWPAEVVEPVSYSRVDIPEPEKPEIKHRGHQIEHVVHNDLLHKEWPIFDYWS